MPAPTHQKMKLWGLGLFVLGAVFRLLLGASSVRFVDWLNSTSGLEPETAFQALSVIDSTLIPLGIALVVGGIVVAAIRPDPRSIEEKSP